MKIQIIDWNDLAIDFQNGLDGLHGLSDGLQIGLDDLDCLGMVEMV